MLAVVLLGREQATVTAVRLTDLDLDYTALVFSTMSRAVETADIVHGYFPCLPVVRDDVLCEGAPIRPEPAGGSWRPELYVGCLSCGQWSHRCGLV